VKKKFKVREFRLRMSPRSKYFVKLLVFDTHSDWDAWENTMEDGDWHVSSLAVAACYRFPMGDTFEGGWKCFQTIAVCANSATLAEDIIHEVSHAATHHLELILKGKANDERRSEITSHLSVCAMQLLGIHGHAIITP
jgi:hypothetical protein